MKKIIVISKIGVIVLFSFLFANCSETLVNLTQLKAVKIYDSSRVPSHPILSALNDGKVGKTSLDNSFPAYNNWKGKENNGKWNWVQYEWDVKHKIKEFEVFWFVDTHGLKLPTEAYIEYWDDTEWRKIGDIGTKPDVFNCLKKNVFSKKVRLHMRGDKSTAISEFRVNGIETTDYSVAEITPYVKYNDGELLQQNYIQSLVGNSVSFHPEIEDGIIYAWSGPNGFVSSEKNVQLGELKEINSGTYTFCSIDKLGVESICYFNLTVKDGSDKGSFIWPKYDPTIHYNFRDEYPDFPLPTKNLDDQCSGEAWRIDDGWWTFIAGENAHPLVTETAVRPLLKRLNDDFGYIRDIMGWPPDKRAMKGYRSAVYLFGSGLCTDDAPQDALGGWQGATTSPDGQVWANILLSYYPVYSFDPACTWKDKEFQKGGVVHEGIHAILSSLPGCRDAAWFHEGANTWLQGTMELNRSGITNYDKIDLGWLSMGSILAPFIPIECYSGWLQDGSFGGPAAQGEYVADESGQKLTNTRYLVGGVQYSSVFATFLGEILGKGSVPWIWQNCPKHVLEGVAEHIGEDQIRRLICEYRARLALADLGRYEHAVLNMYQRYMGTDIGSEGDNYVKKVDIWKATPYAKTHTGDDELLIPEARTTPGWSGANIIPIHTEGNSISIDFLPISRNMSCQLCYRTEKGETVYGEIVYGGECSLNIDTGKAPANGVVFAVICNMDYVYEGDITRTTHHDYRLKLGEGAVQTADIHKNWWDWKSKIK